jgi:hypothetical protein
VHSTQAKEPDPTVTKDGEMKKCKDANFSLYINVCKRNTCENSCIYVHIHHVRARSKQKRGKVSSWGDPGP